MATDTTIDVRDLVKDESDRFWVHRRVYADPQVFEMEMEKIFHKTWVYVGHESEIPDGGDYKSTYIGRRPVIVSRHSDDGRIYVFFNRCRHRGSTVCQQEYGNSNYFRCAYHGWVYNNKGDLVGVTFEDGYGSDFDKGKLGLVQVPRVGSYQGFIFASLSPEGPSLDEHLGNAKPYLDSFAALGPEGIEVRGGAQKHFYKGNWKLQLENTVDSYHFSVLHRSIVDLFAKKGRDMLSSSAAQTQGLDLGNGQGIIDFGSLGYGAGGVTNSAPFNLVVFPNVGVLSIQLRVVRPIAVDLTEVSIYLVRPKGISPEAMARLLREHEFFYGPGSFGGPDDIEVAMERVQRGLQADEVEWRMLDQNLKAERLDERGVRSADYGVLTEIPERAIIRGWKRMMTAA